MSEKTMVTIDCDLIIPEGTEKVFENQHITLDAGIKCNGKLIFKDCKIEPGTTQSGNKGNRRVCKPGCIEVSGTLQMEGCEVIRPGRGFLVGQTMTVQNTSFLLVPPYDAIIRVLVLGNAQIEGCSFVEKAEGIRQTSIGNLISLCSASMKNCTFDNVSGKIDVDTISGCSFTGCVSIEAIDIIDSSFTDCKSITANSGCFKNCDFIHVGDISALSADVDNCRFQNIENDTEGEGVVFIDDSKIVNCTFSGVDLRNNSYLIRGVGDSSVEDCQFTDCLTDREDSVLCLMEQGNSPQIEVKKSVAMGLLKGALKLAGSAALGATGVAAAVARQVGDAAQSELLTKVAGAVQDASFEGIRSMWGMDDAKMVDSMDRDELAEYVNEIRYSLWEFDEDSGDEDPEREAIIEFRKKIDAIENPFYPVNPILIFRDNGG